MGKYITNKIGGYWLYYNSECLLEGIIHVHANKPTPKREGAAKVWVHSDGTSTVVDYGIVPKHDMKDIQKWIYNNVDLIRDEWLSNGLGGEFKEK
jgi:hypothetical protein